MRWLHGFLLLALALAGGSSAPHAQLAMSPIGSAPAANQETRVTVRTAHLEANNRALIVKAMIFNASNTQARNIVVQCEFWVSHRERHAVQRVVKDRPIPPHYGLQFSIDYGRPFKTPPYATTCGVVKADFN
jgi:hypothetical protein